MASYVIMGVAGSGKSSVGAALSRRLGLAYLDADDLHPAANIAKMARGEPLDDQDRAPWLDRVSAVLRACDPVIVGCSALRRLYRDRLLAGLLPSQRAHLTFVHLAGAPEVIKDRMAQRRGHFMPLSLLESQFATLEPPQADERAIRVDIDQNLTAIVDEIAIGIDALAAFRR